jgi:hypothetical protein
MKTLFRKFAYITIFFAVSVSIPVTLVQAEEVDFSCMSYNVKGKTQVSENYKEYDIVVHNRCPGSVYWSMCIERMDPWTNEIQVPLTPSGRLEKQKKTRVNLQMKQRRDKSGTREAYQAFYLDIGYAINSAASARCVASGCESKKRSLRKEFRKNDTEWHKLKTALTARVSNECQSGWDSSSMDVCEARIREGSLAQLDQFAQKDKELKNKLSAVDREQCQVYASE